MKKLLSLLLALAMIFSLMSSMTVFASEDVVPAAEESSEAVSEPADEPVPEDEPVPAEDLLPALTLLPAGDLIFEEEAAPEEEPVSEPDPVEEEHEEVAAEEDILSLDGETTWTRANNFVAGQNYIVGVKNTDDSLTVLQNNGTAVEAATYTSAANVSDAAVWNAVTGFGLVNDGTYLYYNSTLSNTSAKAKWTYAGGELSYKAGGDTYYITFSGTAFGAEKDAASPAKLVIYTDGTDLGTFTSNYTEAAGFVDGQAYIIGVKNADGSIIVIENGGSALVATTIDYPDAATDTMLWTAVYNSEKESYLLANGTTYLYYKNGNVTDDDSKCNWNYNETVLCYNAGGNKNYISIVDGAVTVSTDELSGTLLWTIGEAGSGSEGSGSGSEGGSTTIIYNETKDIGAHAYVALVDADGKALSLDMGWHGETVTIAGEAPNRTMEATKGTSASVVKAEGAPGVALTLEDPPGEINYVYVDDTGALTTVKGGEAADYAGWTYADGKLAYTTAGGTTYYVSDLIGKGTTTDASAAQVITLYGGSEAASGGGGGGGSSEEEADPEAPVIVDQPNVLPYVIVDSGYDAPTVSVSAQLAEGVTANSLYFQWYLDGEKVGDREKFSVADLADGIATSEYTFDELKDKPVGVYNIYCKVSCNIKDAETGEPVEHTTNSFSVSFIVAEGVLNNSFITFSDVHQTYDSIGVAINDVITIHNGFVPALIICTGDWANGHLSGGDETSENYAETMDNYIYRMMLQAGNIDMVFVSGNHDNGAAAADATIDANLGAASDYDGIGTIYDDSYNSADVGTSAANKGLAVFGINYENLEGSSGGMDYNNVLPALTEFLDDTAANYNGELVVISAHAGLHVVNGTSSWSGGASYNVDNANKVVELLNAYAEDYNMDIMFFFGHDHSKGESELLLNPGDTITTVVSYSDSTYEEVPINFSYGHAGYLGTGAAGVSVGHYTLVTWDQESINRLLYALESTTYEDSLSSVDQDRLAEFPEPPAEDDGNEAPDQPPKDDIPNTGDDTPITLCAVVMVLCLGALVAVLPRKKHN